MPEVSQAREQAEILDSIEKLQQTPICADIDTPRIVICGDHTSDKESLIEALTQLPFPPGSSNTQCCIVEFVMRYAANPRVYASIRPSPTRVKTTIRHLREFKYTSQVVSQSETERLFRKAAGHLNKLQLQSGYWHDTLRIEVSGPTQLPLTLIVSPPRARGVYVSCVNVAAGFACTIQNACKDRRAKR